MLICQLTISLTIAFNSWRQYNRMLYDLSQVDLAAKSLKVTKRTQWSSYSIMPATYTSMLFALIYINGILQLAKRLPVQFSCPLFYKYISLVIVKVTHDSILPLKGPYPKGFTIHCIDLVDCPFHLLCPTFLLLVFLFLVSLLLSESFLISFFSVFFSNISNFFSIISNIPDQISYLLSSYLYSVFIVYLSGNSPLWYSLWSSFLAHLDFFLYSFLNLSTRSLIFPKFSFGS